METETYYGPLKVLWALDTVSSVLRDRSALLSTLE